MTRLLMLLGALLFGTALVACGGAGAPGPGAPSLKIYVTDAPFPAALVESASVVIRQVQVRPQGETAESGWQVAFEGAAEIDLVPLTGGVSTLLASIDLPPGIYEEVRLIVEAGEVILKPEAVVAGASHRFSSANGGLAYPSGAQTGIKVKLDSAIVVVTQLTAELTLDFDLSRNFVFNGPMTHAPGVRRVIFTPVVRAVNRSTAGRVILELLSDNATPADVADDVPLGGAGVRALDAEGAEAGSGLTDADGIVSLQLPAGTYAIEIEAPQHETLSSDGFDIVQANLTDLGIVTLAATAGEITGAVLSDRGTVADGSDDLALTGAVVHVTRAGDPSPSASTTTDAQGAFRFADLAPGSYALDAVAPGFAAAGAVDVVPTLGGTGVTLTLAALARSLGGFVTDVGGAAREGVTITARDAADQPVASTTTAADGSYGLVLPTGVYALRFVDAASGVEESRAVVITGTDPISNQVLDVTLGSAP